MYVGDIEADGLLDELTTLHCLVLKKYKKNRWVIACDIDKLPEEFIESLEGKYNIDWIDESEISEHIQKTGTLVIHNLFGYDLEALLKLGLIDEYGYDYIDDTHIKLIDSLSMSRCLNPDRQLPFNCPPKVYNTVTGKYDNVGPHGLAAWGYRVANKKPKVDDWRNQPLEVYLDRCIEDVIINELTLEALMKEAKDIAKGGDWKLPLQINNKSDFLMNMQERDGILIDEDAAWDLVDKIDGMMKEIEDFVEPQLPERDIPKSRQPNFPAKPFTESGDISSHGWNWLRKLGYSINEAAFDKVKIPAKPFKGDGSLSATGIKFCEVMGWTGNEDELKINLNKLRKEQATIEPLSKQDLKEAKQDLKNQKMPKLTEPMRMSNQDDIKKYLVEIEGWQPTVWRTKDVSRDQNKRAYEESVIREKILSYVEDVKKSVYKDFIYEEMGLNFERCGKVKLIRELSKKARYLVTSPKLKDDRGELCPSLEHLKGEMGKQIVKWLSLRNRRSVLKALDEKKETGWLNDKRLDVDGRIGQGFSGVTNTNRYKHVKIVNLPKASPDVLLGKEMRSLLICDKDKVVLGYDGSNLEQFVAASYAYKYDGGDYAAQLEGDAHTTNALAYTKAAGREVSRSEGKNLTYGILYGAQKSKISKMMAVSPEVAQKVINAFWDTNYGLKELRTNLESYWESTGKKYIRGIDGRKIYTRSKHSLVNALFQSCGSIIMFYSGCLMYDMLLDEGLIGSGVKRLAFVHDEYEYEVPKKLIKTKKFISREEAEKWVDPEGRLWSNVKEVNGNYYRFYCRVGELGNESLKLAAEHFKMAMPFSAAYDIGKNFAETH